MAQSLRERERERERERDCSATSGQRGVTAPRPREQRRPPSPPDRLPPRRGGRPTSNSVFASAPAATRIPRPSKFLEVREHVPIHPVEPYAGIHPLIRSFALTFGALVFLVASTPWSTANAATASDAITDLAIMSVHPNLRENLEGLSDEQQASRAYSYGLMGVGGSMARAGVTAGKKVNLRAYESALYTPGSVRLELTGPQTISRTDNTAPFTLFEDIIGRSLPAGTYQFRATAYAAADLYGPRLTTLTASFTLVTDTVPPDVRVICGVETPDSDSETQVKIAISEPVVGFDQNDIEFTNIRLPHALSVLGTRPPFNGDWWIYTFNVEPEPAGGETTIRVPAGIAADEVGNFNTASQPLHIARNRKVSVADARATEGTDAEVNFVVTLDARNDCETATVDWATADGTAIADTDYAAASGTLTFGPGETTKTVSVAVLDDTEPESDETFTLQLSRALGATIIGATAAGTITNDDVADTEPPGPPTVTVTSKEPETVDAGDDFVAVVTFSKSVSGFEMSELEVTNGSVQSMSGNSDGTQYTATIRAKRAFTGEITIAVPAGVATDAEGNANMASAVFAIWSIAGGGSNWVDGNPTATLRCTRDDHERRNKFNFDVAFNKWVQGFRLVVDTEITSHPAVFTVIISAESPGPNGFTSYISGGVSTPDAESSQFTVKVPAGVATDQRDNPNTASGTLRFAINRTVSVADASATEGPDARMEFTVTLNAPDDCATETVHWTTVDGTATAGEDYTGAKGTLTFGPGETSKTVRVAVLNDAEDDSGETFTLRLSNASGATIADGEATGTIADEEPTVESMLRIDGVPQVGNTLRVLVDERRARYRRAARAEPPSGALTYQWLRGSEVIAGATASTYVLTVADVGARLSVRVESGDGSVTNAETPPVWSAPVNPSLADGEEELLSATVTLGSHRFPFSVAGYGRVQGESFGEMDVVSFKDGGTTFAIDAFLVNSRGVFALATGSTLPDASGLVAYWNGYRISGLEGDTANGGRLPMLVGRTPQPSTEYSRYEDGASDGVQVAVSLRRVSAEAQNALTASFEAMPEAHDGESAFRFRVAFSERIAISYRSLREDAFAVTGGRVTRGTRVDRRKDLFEITVEPDGAGEVTISLPAGRECSVSGAICTWGPPRKQLTNTPTATVAGPAEESAPAPLTASFVDVPAEHDGETAFKLRMAFSERLSWMNGRRLREDVVAVSGGRATKGKRVNRRRDLWDLTVEPDSLADVTVTLAAGAACDSPAAVCTKDGRALSTTISTTVRGPVAVSVADARAEEGTDETIDFAVSLSRAASATVAVAYATADGSATAGADYTATNGTLTFTPGETLKTVAVPVLDDAHDEGEETLTFRLTTPSGAVLADGEATGTIENSDPLQRAWLARFGRTVATHVTDAVGNRLRDTPGQGSHITVGGSRLPLGQRGAAGKPEAGARESALLQGVAGLLGLGSGQAGGTGTDPWGDRPAVDPRLGQSQSVNLDLRRLLLGSSFRLALGRDDVESSSLRLTAWGRVAGTTFDGRDGRLTLDGDVLTGTVGVDGEWDRLLAGLAVAHSRGDGSFTMPGTEDRGRGGLENTLTSVHPYLRYAVNDRLAVWGLFGYGWGELDLEMDNGMTIETDTNLVMGAFGGRGILLAAPESGGFQLATRTDAMLTRTTSDKVAEMESAEADAHRLRLVLEGSRGFAWAEGRSLTPTMEVGLRHDWGDAETGFGLELGGRVQYADPALGLTIDAAVRGLLAHEDSDYEEWGASGTVRVAPGAGGQGLSLTLAPAWGATASGVDGLWSRQTTAGLAPQGTRQTPSGRLTAEIGYGVAAPFGAGLLTPYAGTVLSDGADRTYRVGTRVQLGGPGATGLQVSLEGTRQEPAGQQPVNQGLRLQATWRF